MKSTSIFQPVIACLVLALGVAVLWGFAVGGIGSSLVSMLGGRSLQDNETIIIDNRGRTLIQTNIAGSYQNQTFRTLEGVNVEAPFGQLTTAGLQPATRAPRLVEYPLRWGQRIAGITAPGNPPVSWLLVRNDERPGSAYFVGYELRSNERIGFLGREGFQAYLPAEDERFDFGNHVFQWGSNRYASVGQLNLGAIGHSYGIQVTGSGTFHPTQVFLCDGDAVREVDLRSREVRKVGEYDGLLGIAIVGIVLPEETEDAPQTDRQPETENRLLLLHQPARLAEHL